MDSLLTRERPNLWRSTVALATRLTGYEYAPKLPLPDGTIYACGGGGGSLTPEERKRRIENTIKYYRECLDNPRLDQEWLKKEIEQFERDLVIVEEELKNRNTSARVFVPEGAMEWILHEVGHWIAASPEERALPNYGLTQSEIGQDGDREWQAWAFEEIVLAPFGPSRLFAPPTQRDGAAFAKAGPMPWFALRHVERSMQELSVDVEEWRALYCEWIKFERGRPTPSWERVS